jgi:hypothetical protein
MGSTPTLRTLHGVKIGAVWFNGPAHTLQYRVSGRASYGDLGFAGPPWFWTRTSGTWGARDTTELNWYDYEVPMARVTGTVAVDTAHCDTYVYQVFSSASLADSIGWWPCRPGEARIAYTAIGVLSGTTDAPTPLNRAGLACPSVVTGRRFVVGLDAPVGVEIRGELLDVLGRRVGDWRERSVHDGLHEYELEAPRAAGVYYLRVRVGGQQHSGRVVVMR